MEEKKNNKIIYIVIAVVIVIAAFGGGYLLHGALNKEETKCEAKDTNTGTDTKPVEEKKSTEVMDNIAVNLYGGGYIYFILDDSLYYLEADLLEDGRYFLLTYAACLRDDAGDEAPYCDGNPIYKRKAVKVAGIENVTKIRVLHRPGATDESFETFAITEDGNAYILRQATAEKYYGNNDVEDLISERTVLLKDGTTKTIE